MEKEKNCSNCKHTNKTEDEFPCSVCVRNYIDKYEPTTNYDRIKSMSVEDLIEFINNISTSLAVKMNGEYIVREKDSIKQWLLQEVSEDDR